MAPILHTVVGYIKQFNPMDTYLYKSVAGFTSFFGSKVKKEPKKEPFDEEEAEADPEADPEAEAEADPEADPESASSNDTPPGLIPAIMAVIADPNTTTILNLVLVLFYYLLVVLLGSFIINDLMFSHWLIRLYTFCFFIYLSSSTQFFVYPIATYYIVMALYNGYINFRDKPKEPRSLLPPHYALIPIMTSRGGQFDFLNPFTYFSKGATDDDDTYHFFKKDEVAYKIHLDSVIPDFPVLKTSSLYKFPDLIKTFHTYLDDLNRSYLVLQKPTPISGAEKDNSQADRDVVEQNITTAIAKAAGKKTKEYIQMLGKPGATDTTQTAA